MCVCMHVRMRMLGNAVTAGVKRGRGRRVLVLLPTRHVHDMVSICFSFFSCIVVTWVLQ